MPIFLLERGNKPEKNEGVSNARFSSKSYSTKTLYRLYISDHRKVHGGQFLVEPRQNVSYMENFFMKIIKGQT